jgi:uncharacterized RDD family membrane protein YckC
MSGRKLEGQYAGFLSRAVGLFLDYAIISAIVVGAGILFNLLFSGLGIDLNACQANASIGSFKTLACQGAILFLVFFAIIISPLYYVFFWSLTGQTLGQRVMGVRVVRLNGRRLGFWLSLIRWIGYQLCIFTLGFGFLWVLIDNRRMGWHDKLARTCVIYAWKAEQNEDFVARVNRRFSRRKGETVHSQTEPDSTLDTPASQEQLAG